VDTQRKTPSRNCAFDGSPIRWACGFDCIAPNLPGKPDIVFPKYRLAVFVHGCFWHRHPGCKRARMPKTNRVYWRKKFKSNTVRDRRVAAEMASLGWLALVFWECETSDVDAIARRFRREVVGCRAARLPRRTGR